MGFQYRKSKKIVPGIRMNTSLRGTSFSFGKKGFSYNIGSKRSSFSFKIPGTKIRYRTTSSNNHSKLPKKGAFIASTPINSSSSQQSYNAWKDKTQWGCVSFIVAIFLFCGFLVGGNPDWAFGSLIIFGAIYYFCILFPQRKKKNKIYNIKSPNYKTIDISTEDVEKTKMFNEISSKINTATFRRFETYDSYFIDILLIIAICKNVGVRFLTLKFSIGIERVKRILRLLDKLNFISIDKDYNSAPLILPEDIPAILDSLELEDLFSKSNELNKEYEIEDKDKVNRFYINSYLSAWRKLDYVIGYNIHRGSGCDDCEICKKGEGRYTLSFKWDGWYKQCNCYITPILLNEKELQDYDTTIGRRKQLRSIPMSFREWYKENQQSLREKIYNGSLNDFISPNTNLLEIEINYNDMGERI